MAHLELVFPKDHPHFSFKEEDYDLAISLRSRVFNRLKTINKREWQLQLKALILPLVYFGFYFLALFSSNFFLFVISYSFMGLLLVVIFLNLIHEACHGNLFKKKTLNYTYLYLFDLIGANSFMWKKRHVVFHHNFPNIKGWDSDLEKSRFLKVHPNQKGKWLTKHQHLIFVLYPFFLLNWFLIRDFRDFFMKNLIVSRSVKIPILEYFKLFLFKIIFVGYIFILPIYLTPFSKLEVFFAGIILFFVAGCYALFVLIPPHVNTNNEFPEVDEKNILSNSWLMHQLITTNDVIQENWFTRYIMGNFNYHVAHHLFPKVSYLYAKEVTEEVRNFCKEHALPYKSLSIWKALKDHYRLIRNNGSQLDIWEEDM
jgi:linoleoyl-CoA desaturase